MYLGRCLASLLPTCSVTPRLSRLSGGSGRARLFHSGPPRPLRPPLEETRKKTNQQIREETNAERRAYLESASRTCLSLLLHQDTSVVTETPLLLLAVSKEDWTPFERKGQRTCVQLPATISEERASHRAPSEIVCLSSSERVFIVKHKEDILRRKRYHGEPRSACRPQEYHHRGRALGLSERDENTLAAAEG